MNIIKRIFGAILGAILGGILATIINWFFIGGIDLSHPLNPSALIIGAVVGGIIGFVYYRIPWRIAEFFLDLF